MKAWFLALLLLSGCTAYRLKPDLDRELTPQAQELVRHSQLEVVDRLNYLRQEFVADNPELLSEFAKASANRVEIASIVHKTPPMHNGCFEPMMTVITLGLIPAVCDDEYAVKVNYYHEGARPQSTDVAFRETRVWGWASLFLLPFANWHAHTDHFARAINTSLNRLAK